MSWKGTPSRVRLSLVLLPAPSASLLPTVGFDGLGQVLPPSVSAPLVPFYLGMWVLNGVALKQPPDGNYFMGDTKDRIISPVHGEKLAFPETLIFPHFCFFFCVFSPKFWHFLLRNKSR